MASIDLFKAAQHTVRPPLPHQQAAWNWLQEQQSDKVLAEFAEIYRAAPPDPEAPRLITAEQCEAIFLRPITAEQLTDLNSCLARFSINTPARMRHFLAQIGHESGGLRWLKEIADGTDYEGRSDLGNTNPGDGPRFKGAGAIQLTGRANYEDLAAFIHDPRVMDGCDYVSVRYPFTSAGFWWHNNRINSLVDAGASCRAISARVNGRDPANGLADREAYFERALQAIPDLASPPKPPLQQEGVLLKVPYESQNDNASGTGWRECMSSSCAMIARFYGKIGSDDAYNVIRRRYGDTTIHAAHVQALQSLGLKARFITNGTIKLLEDELSAGRPVAVGWLHHGPASHPSGGGHWTVAIGFTEAALIMNDPNGEADMVNGGYRNHTNGKGIAYSRKNWLRRWLPDGASCGWAILVNR